MSPHPVCVSVRAQPTLRPHIRRVIALPVLGLLALLLAGCGGAEDRAAKHFKRGLELVAEGKHVKAKLEFKNVLQIDPKDVAARVELARTLERLGELRPAVGQYRAAIKLDAKHVPAKVGLGFILLAARQVDAAAKLAEEAYALAPGDADVLTLLGGVRINSDAVDEGRKDLEAALAVQPSQVRAILLLASSELRAGNLDAASELLEAGIKTNPQDVSLRMVLAELASRRGDAAGTVAPLAEIVRLQPDNLGHHLRLARAHERAGDMDSAGQILQQSVSSFADSMPAKLSLVEFTARSESNAAAERELITLIEANPDEAVLRLSLARLYEVDKRLDEASAVYRTLIERELDERSTAMARNRLARLLFSRKQVDEAKAQLALILAAHPKDRQALTMRAQSALSEGDAVAAINDLRAALLNNPNDVAVLRLLARAHRLNEDAQLAEDTLRRAVEVAPREVGPRADRAALYAKTARLDEALAELEQILLLSPGNQEVLRAMFVIHARRGDGTGALATADRLKAAHPESAAGYYLAGLAQQGARDYAASIQEFEAALTRAPDALGPVFQLARSHLALGEADSAMAQAERALAAAPDNHVALNMKGELLLRQQKFAQAKPLFAQAISANPRFFPAYRNLASVHLRAGEHSAAVQVFNDAIGELGRQPHLLMALALAQESAGQASAAMSTYDEVLKLDANAQAAANNLAMLLVAESDADPAALDRALELAQRLDRANPAFLDTLGWVHLQRAEVDASIEALEAAVAKVPQAGEFRYHLGMAYLAKGDKARARSELSKAIAGKASFRGIERARKTLSALAKSSG